MTYNFTKKQNFHSDELWSYGFAASSEGAYIYMNDEQTEEKNFNEWISTDVMRDYIVVDSDEVFDYKSVYNNCAADIHPPIYFFVLHFVLALFKGTWSKWYAFVINLIAFAIMQVFLLKTIKLISKEKGFALMCMTYFGFTMGAVNITIYLRNYALGTAFVMMYIYFTARLFYDEDDCFWKNTVKAGISLILAVLTVHLSMFFAFVFTAFSCICFLIKKKVVTAVRYGYSMLIAALFSIVLFPATIPHLFTSGEIASWQKYPTDWQFKIYWAYLHHDITGFRNSIWPEMTFTYLLLGLLAVSIILVPISFVLRKEAWYERLIEKAKHSFKSLWSSRKEFPFLIFIMFFSVFSLLWVDAYVTNIFHMAQYSRRYMFVIYPVFWCYISTFFFFPIRWIFKKKSLRYVVCSVLLIMCMVVVVKDRILSFYFIYDEKEGIQFEDIESDANIVIDISDHFVLVCVTDQLMDKGSFYAVQHESLLKKEDSFFESDEMREHPMYVAICLNGLAGESGEDKKEKTEVEERPVEADEEDNEREWGELPKYKDVYQKMEQCVAPGKLERVGYDVVFSRHYEIYKVVR